MYSNKIKTKKQQFKLISEFSDPDYVESRNIKAVESNIKFKIRDEIRRRLRFQSKVRILDMGCGFGEALKEILKGPEFGGKVEVHGITAKPFKGMPGYIKVGDLTGPHFPKNSFDLVFSSNAIMYVPDKLEAIKRAVEYIKPRGIVTFNQIGELKLNKRSWGSQAKMVKNLVDRKRSGGINIAAGDKLVITKEAKNNAIEFQAQFAHFRAIKDDYLPVVQSHYFPKKRMQRIHERRLR
ncbi:MAG: class I SAM-dependent methyltransferase [archaeon]